MKRNQILYYAVKYDGMWIDIKEALERHDTWEMLDYDCSFMTICDDIYPNKLREMEHPPWILFYKGNIELLNEKISAVIGSRKPDAYGYEKTKEICEHISEDVMINGASRGIETKALQYADRSIIVSGTGLDMYYPFENDSLFQSNEKEQLVISEYPLGSKPYAIHYPWRDRLIGALADRVFALEIENRSREMLLVKNAMDLQKEIYAVPHPYDPEYQDGYVTMLEMGAKDILEQSAPVNQMLM